MYVLNETGPLQAFAKTDSQAEFPDRLKKWFAPQLPANDDPLSGVHHPVGSLQRERGAHRGRVLANLLGSWLLEICVT